MRKRRSLSEMTKIPLLLLICCYVCARLSWTRVLSCRTLSHGLKTRVQCTLMNTRTHNNRQIILDPYQRVCCFKTCIGNPMNATIYVTSLPERRKKKISRLNATHLLLLFGVCTCVFTMAATKPCYGITSLRCSKCHANLSLSSGMHFVMFKQWRLTTRTYNIIYTNLP